MVTAATASRAPPRYHLPMNYPQWSLPGSGLLIAVVAILHVFVSHFAVGGGLFLVVTEWKARREKDDALLDYVRRHSRFFVLITLVFGAVTGVGIWFTIGLVHPAATSSLINAFVWGWAIEWTFFLTEIAAALVYFYGWDRLSARTHLTVGWIYFGAAWASLLVINGILTFMLTPGAWLETHTFWSGYFNPTFWPSLVIRTLGAIGLAGIYALFTASWIAMPELKKKLAGYATLWILPLAIVLPLSLLWYFKAAESAGVPVTQIFGGSVNRAMTATTSGHPIAQMALRTVFGSAIATLVLVVMMYAFRRANFGRILTAAIMLGGLLTIGGAEWVREDLRKPYVIGSTMYVNGVRADDARDASVLEHAKFVRRDVEQGQETFRVLCSSCHTIDGYLAVRPLVQKKSSAALVSTLDRLDTWRDRRMPPFTGNEDEKYALAVYLAKLGGGTITPRVGAIDGAAIFDSHCGACHGHDSEWQIAPRVTGKSEQQLYDALGRLPQLNDMMPPFDGTDAERRALAKYLDTRS
jgi:cytochrome bd-type quinol oxidase subunit 1/mono/diheme cytochrome c family protein